MVRRVVQALFDAGVSRVEVVLGHEEARLREALVDSGAGLIANPDWSEGMGRSIAIAATALAEESSGPPAGLLIAFGDLPSLRPEEIRSVLEAFERDPSPSSICVPNFEGRVGHPVLFGAAHLPALAALDGDRGATTRTLPFDQSRGRRHPHLAHDASRSPAAA